jgi:hypothetical protein
MEDALWTAIRGTFAALCLLLTVLAAKSLFKSSWFRAMRLPILIELANCALWLFFARFLALPGTTIVWNICRLGIMAWSGFSVTRRGASGLVGSAFAAVAILFVDHMVLKGGWFLFQYALGHSTDQYSYGMAFGGVVVSFAMFSPFVALLGVCGGLCGRHFKINDAAATGGPPSKALDEDGQANGPLD